MDSSLCLHVQGYSTAHVKAGLKKAPHAIGDMGVIIAETPAVAAGVFTRSMAAAAPVHVCRAHLASGSRIKAILVNAGNANACTGEQGEANCRQLCTDLAGLLKVDDSAILPFSTGVIGSQLPMDLMQPQLQMLVEQADETHGFGLAQTIMTTDLVPKWTSVKGLIGGRQITLSGIAKGSGMIAPNMATMLSFVITDAAVDPQTLSSLWRDVCSRTFNRVTVDTDTSTNDSAVILANGAAGNPEINSDHPELGRFRALLFAAVNPLAKAIAADGEGATKLIKVTADGFGSDGNCRQISRTIAESPLVKTAMYGNDPNWGRIIAAAGRAGVEFDPQDVTITLSGTPVFVKGEPAAFDAARLSQQLKAKEAYIDIHGGSKGGIAYFYTCDYSYDYIKINAEYHT